MKISLHATAALRKDDPTPSIVHQRAEIETRVQEALDELRNNPAWKQYTAAQTELDVFDANLPEKMRKALQGRSARKDWETDKVARQARALRAAANTIREPDYARY